MCIRDSVAPYPTSVPRAPYHHTRPQCLAPRSTIPDSSTTQPVAPTRPQYHAHRSIIPNASTTRPVAPVPHSKQHTRPRYKDSQSTIGGRPAWIGRRARGQPFSPPGSSIT
eukprot:2132995-Rhodomonas_salina.4